MTNKIGKKLRKEGAVPDFGALFAAEYAKAGGKTRTYKDKDGTKVVEIMPSYRKKISATKKKKRK